jgi:hypothetical protein
VTRPRLHPALSPGQHSCGCDRRLGSDSPRHIPGPATFFVCVCVTFSPTPLPLLFLKNAVSSQEGPSGRWLQEGNVAWISWNMRNWSPSPGGGSCWQPGHPHPTPHYNWVSLQEGGQAGASVSPPHWASDHRCPVQQGTAAVGDVDSHRESGLRGVCRPRLYL